MEKNLGKRYTEEFKKMIVELYLQGKTKKYLSQEYGVSSNTIREWLTREKKEIKQTIIHTDRGSQYLSKEYRKYCKENNLELSYSRKGNPYDNACIESFHATLKKEYVHHKKFKNLEEIRKGIFEYIESWYNRKRIQEKLGYLSPVEYEEQLKNEIKINRVS